MPKNYDKEFVKEHFHYDPSDPHQILERAKLLVGKTISQVISQAPSELIPDKHDLASANKGTLGNLIEELWFGIRNNPTAEPDFSEAGIELKIVPLTLKGKEFKVKERTKVCSINFFDLVDEKWVTSHAKQKLDQVLFVYYEYHKERIGDSKVRHVELWHLEDEVENKVIIQDDWERVHGKVREGLAHQLSESLSRILAASRTGSGGVDASGKARDLVEQSIEFQGKRELALRRAFSLKQSFTNQRWLQFKKVPFESVIESLGVRPTPDFESITLDKLREFEGMSLGEFAKKFKIPIPKGKNAAATLIKKMLGFKNVNSKVKEFEQCGIEVRIVPVRESDHMPLEGISFPAFTLNELIEEEWRESDLAGYLDRLLFIPIYRKKRTDPLKRRVIGKAFFWTPSRTQWKTITNEWAMYVAAIKAGKAKVHRVKWGKSFREVTGLAKESETEIIHIRPHGQDREDRDTDHLGNSVVKQSFWLNKHFIHQLIQDSLAH